MGPEESKAQAGPARHRMRLPGFIGAGREVGLGDVVGRATSLVGLRPCGACSRRAEALNRWLSLSGSRRVPK
jgi:hypothetical protein